MKTQTKRLHSTISIVNVSSVLGLATTPLAVTESALQHGVVALTRSCALDYARQGIRLNCVCPGAREDLLQGKTSLSKQEETKTPTGTLCKIQDIVDAVMFLASSKSNGISGHALPVDGAWMLHHI